MLCIVDERMPGQAKDNLSGYAEIIEFQSENIVYDAVSGHPDIFFCKFKNKLIVAPNLPEKIKIILQEKQINFIYGKKPVNERYPESAIYNAVIADDFFIHRLDITDTVVIESADYLEKIDVRQGYTRCSLLPLKGNNFITSDSGVSQTLNEKRLNVLHVNPHDIVLPGFSHGFFGGACAVLENKIFIAGNLNFFTEGRAVRDYLHSLDYEIIELYNGLLFDCGSILFVS